MQLFVLVLFLSTIVFGHEGDLLPGLALNEGHGWALLLIVILPKLILGAVYAAACRLTLKRMAKPDTHVHLRRMDRITSMYRVCILVLYVHDLARGTLHQLRHAIGESVIVVPDLLIMAPPLALLIWGWWAYYPIDCRLRNAQLVGRLDQGLPIHSIWTRKQYLVAQIRYQVALLFVPLTALLVLSQVIEHHVRPLYLRPLLQVCGAGCIFLFAPVVIRHIWDTAPLPDGELRDRLMAMCRQHRVGVRELLIWKTFGGMVNAAVMGLVRPLRYILLSDGLLEMLRQPHVEAVMAHELAHVRRRHMVWLLASATALMLALVILWNYAVAYGEHLSAGFAPAFGTVWSDEQRPLAAHIAVVASTICWFIGFGWVSRRFERQADAFAIQHLSHQRAGREGEVRVDENSAYAMIETLEQVARLNHIDPRRRSWRHGSIAWRQHYLWSLVGLPTHRIPIDRHMFWLKCATVVALIAGGAFIMFLSSDVSF